MARRARLLLPGVPLHIIQRGNNRQDCFRADDDYRQYLEWLAEYAKASGCRVHAYVLMSNHCHLLVSGRQPEGPAALMKALGQRYVQYFNRRYGRTGSLWEGRFRSCPVQQESYFMACQRYIELNPVRAGIVKRPGDYRWSSYRANAEGVAEEGPDASIVTPHALYRSLGVDDVRRHAAYRELHRLELEPHVIGAIRAATNGNYALGNERFAKKVAAVSGQRAVRGRAGRPRKKPPPKDGGAVRK
jgi:putative transposase